MKYRQRSRYIFGIILAVTFLIAGLSFFVPVAPTVENPFQEHMRTAIALVVASFFLSSAVWFLRGLRGFKKDLRVAYRLLALGMGLLSLSLVQLPVLGFFDLWDSAWATEGGVILPFVIAALPIYAATRRLGRLLELKSPLTSYRVIVPLVFIFTVLSGIAAFYAVQYDSEGIEMYIATVGWVLGYLLAAMILTYRITRVIGAEYTVAMRQLSYALLALTLGVFHEYFFTIFFTNGDLFVDYGIYLWPFLVAGFLFLHASHAFYMLAARGSVEDTESDAPLLAINDEDYFNSVTSVATMASRPNEIDPILDDVRSVTSALSPGARLSEADKRRLLAVYRRLEAYLTQHDPLRNFTEEEIRRRTTPAFRSLLRMSN